MINKILSFKTTDFCLPLNYSWYIIAATVSTSQVPTSGRNVTSNLVGKGGRREREKKHGVKSNRIVRRLS